MSTFTKARLLTEPEYEQWRNCHYCNGDQVEKMDMLNKKYADTISSEQSNREQNMKPVVPQPGTVDTEVENTTIETPTNEMVSPDNDDSSVSNVAEASNSNPSSTNELTTDGLDNYEDSSMQENISNSPLKEVDITPPSSTPITQASPSKVYNCIPQAGTSSKSVIAGEENSKPYKCTIPKCMKRYATPYNVRRHIIKHHGIVPKSKVIRTKGKFPRVIKSTRIYRGKNPKLVAINGTPLEDDDVIMNNEEENVEVPLPPDDGEFSEAPVEPRHSRWSSNRLPPRAIIRRSMKTRSCSKKEPQTNFNQEILNNRTDRKRRNVIDDSEEEDVGLVEKYSRGSDSRGSGSKFYYSWD